jgi:hypothetical protein
VGRLKAGSPIPTCLPGGASCEALWPGERF